MSIYKQPKDIKTSNRLKYNRRRNNLRHAIKQFLFAAELRLDKDKSGEIYKRGEVENLTIKCKELLAVLPAKEELDFSNIDFVDFLEAMDEGVKETKKIIEAGEQFFKENDFNEMLQRIEEMKQLAKENEKRILKEELKNQDEEFGWDSED